MEKITSREDLKAYMGETGFLPLYRNNIEGFSVEELAGPGHFRAGEKESDPLCWKRDLSRDTDLALASFFDGREGFVSKEMFPVFAAYRRRAQILKEKEEGWWERLREWINREGFINRKAAAGILDNMGAGRTCDRFLKRLQAGSWLIQEYEKKEIRYVLPEQRWGQDYVSSGPATKEEAWVLMTDPVLTLYPCLTQRQLLVVLGVGKDRRSVVRQKHNYPDNLFERLEETDSLSQMTSGTGKREKGISMDRIFDQLPDRRQREDLADRLLDHVRGKERELLLLRYKDQMTVPKICEATGLSDEYVRKRIRNGIRRIQMMDLYSWEG